MTACRGRRRLAILFSLTFCMLSQSAQGLLVRYFISRSKPFAGSLLSMSSDAASVVVPSSKLVVILAGPTGVGKSDVAARICASQKGIIVSADSVQAYRGVQIGANKPDAAELKETPHMLVNVADHTENYNAADWRHDALYTIRNLSQQPDDWLVEQGEDPEEMKRKDELRASIDEARKLKQYAADEALLPVVVGGTMMYLQWLVHGQPDALRPSEEALRKAGDIIPDYQSKDDWEGAVLYVGSLGPAFASQITTLCGKDWYRLRRILEMAYTVQEKKDDGVVEKLYSGLREGSLASLDYDVRCFFLCPDDRMKHTKVVDRRCEDMVRRGLLQETTDLVLSGSMPAMASKAIGYRQTLDYLGREGAKDQDEDSFQEYLDQFTTATRRYCKKQMQWFRKDEEFVFVPVALSKDKPERVQSTADEIERLIGLSRDDFDGERLLDTSRSALVRKANEAQGKKMKTYKFERHILKMGSKELEAALKDADECSNRLQAKKPRLTEQTLPQTK
jgi:tRNA dimethylallyltransferase